MLGGIIINEYNIGSYVENVENDNKELTVEVKDWEVKYDNLEEQMNEQKKNMDESLLKAFLEGYFKPASGVFLLDDYEMTNASDCSSFSDSARNMKGQTYNNGLQLFYDGEVTFYL